MELLLPTMKSCQIYLGTTYQNGKNIPSIHKIYPMAVKQAKRTQTIPTSSIARALQNFMRGERRKVLATKKALQNVFKYKLGILVRKYGIWQPCTETEALETRKLREGQHRSQDGSFLGA
jgi:hypothetical protein